MGESIDITNYIQKIRNATLSSILPITVLEFLNVFDLNAN